MIGRPFAPRTVMPPRLSATVRNANVGQHEPLKRQMEEWYSDYSKRYDLDGYHTRIAERLVAGVEIHEGDRILDLATGTGLAGFAALKNAGVNGSLVGVDIAHDMLNVAAKAAETQELNNVEFVLADAQKLDLEKESFDVILCSSALVLFPDVHWTLSYWREFLVPGGRFAAHCFSQDSFIRGKLIQKAAAEFGIELIFSEPTGTVEKCEKLFAESGFTSIEIDRVENGKYVDLQAILEAWDRMILHPMVQLPARVGDASRLEQIKEKYNVLAKEAETDKGLWDDDTIMYVYARRPAA